MACGFPLAALTTFKAGGVADWFVEPRSVDELVAVLGIVRAHGLTVTMLGGGSNVLVADAGVRGVVVRPRLTAIGLVDATTVRAEAGVTINGLVRWMVGRGCSGLEAWAGTPGTVGGGIVGNAHFQGRLLSEVVRGVRVIAPDGRLLDLAPADMGFGYDRSRLQKSGEVLVWADFACGAGDTDALRAVARASLAFRKRTQPLHMPSAGCVFQNPAPDAPLPAGVPRSAGALIDRAGLKGVAAGGARVSPIHANFIVNENQASAADIRALIERCRAEVARQFGVRLEDEIVYLGDFDDRRAS